MKTHMQSLQAGDTWYLGLSLDLDEQSLAVYLNGTRLGLLVSRSGPETIPPLTGPVQWVVVLNTGSSMKMVAKPPPPRITPEEAEEERQHAKSFTVVMEAMGEKFDTWCTQGEVAKPPSDATPEEAEAERQWMKDFWAMESMDEFSIRLQREAEDTVMTEKLKYFPGLDAASLLSKCVQQICAALPQRSVRTSAFQIDVSHARTAIMHALADSLKLDLSVGPGWRTGLM